MRLVGASSLYIPLPFLLEALVAAVIGVALAGGRAGGLHVLRRRRAVASDPRVHALDRLAGYGSPRSSVAILGRC